MSHLSSWTRRRCCIPSGLSTPILSDTYHLWSSNVLSTFESHIRVHAHNVTWNSANSRMFEDITPVYVSSSREYFAVRSAMYLIPTRRYSKQCVSTFSSSSLAYLTSRDSTSNQTTIISTVVNAMLSFLSRKIRSGTTPRCMKQQLNKSAWRISKQRW